MNAPDDDPNFEMLLDYLKRNRGFDFAGYKRTSLMRRILKRMQAISMENYVDYVDYLEVHPEEFVYLFNTILINVTTFFRDKVSWDYLADKIIPRILAGKTPNDPIRVWSAGCASGEEAYTIAMLLAENLGTERFRERVKIYASDVDEDALNQARQASYPVRLVAGIPEDYLRKYFDNQNGQYVFHKELRRAIIFGNHDLIQDAPISRIDLLVCRNTLMYFNAETQSKILMRFHFALSQSGFLFLGKAEMLFTHLNLFTPVDLKRRVFSKVPRVNRHDPVRLITHANHDEIEDHVSQPIRFREAAFDASPVAQIVIDRNGILALANERARSLFGMTVKDVGRPFQELEFAFRIPEFRARIEEANAERRPSAVKEVEWVTTSGEVRTLEVQITPLLDANDRPLGANATFTDMARYKRLQEELEHSNQELETAYEELQSTNEELETTNEELQSTNEELETTNEELQSTNEELETINEELQSTNEELQTVNEEFRHRTEELNQANNFLEAILTSLRSAVVAVNQDFQVQAWSQRAEDLWGLRRTEVQGKNFLNLDIGLPVDQLKPTIRATLSGEYAFHEQILAATNRRGKTIQCKIVATPLYGSDANAIQGAILLMEEQDARHEEA